jgi:UDPglucose 6-dehydrogenase
MRIAVVGAGYVGLVSGACFAELGFETWCIDKDEEKIESLKRGEMPIFEANLEEIVVSNFEQGRLHFTTSMAGGIPQADVVILAVGTPEREDGSVDLDSVFGAGLEVARHLEGTTIIITKSTVPVGTSRSLYRKMREANPVADFETASNPEFLREGEAVMDFMNPDRIVIGVASERSAAILRRLYRPQQLVGVPIEVMSPETAELTKYACNSFLATKVGFINDVSDLCQAVNGDIRQLGRAMGLDSRIGPKFLEPGPGFGGSCFPKDTKGFALMGRDAGAPQKIVEAVIGGNAQRKRELVNHVRAACRGSLADRRVAVLGLTFKPDTNDVRESPALELLPALAAEAAEVRAHDPRGIASIAAVLSIRSIKYCADLWDSLKGADALVILTQWADYRSLDWNLVRNAMRGTVIVDFRNICDPEQVTGCGLDYHGIGVKPAPAKEPAQPSVAAE